MNVSKKWQLTTLLLGALAFNCGCPEPESVKKLSDKASQEAEQVTESLKEEAGKLAEKGEEMTEKLGEQAKNLFEPLKEKLAGLEGLKDKPAELKTSVTEMLTALETSISNVQLPEPIKTTLDSLKEQLTEFNQYLDGAVEPDKVQEHIDSLKNLVQSHLGS